MELENFISSNKGLIDINGKNKNGKSLLLIVIKENNIAMI